MIQIYSEKLPRILKNKKILEKKLKVKITNQGREVFVDGKPEDEYTAEKVISALNFGFEFGIAILIKEEDNMFEVIAIKDHTKRRDLSRIRARIIGKQGKTKKTFTNLTKCFFEIRDNEVGIIGEPEHIENAQTAIISIIKGTKQSNVYSYLEKHQVKPVIDLGLKR
jgi:ribosomal RNA assembly protein